LDATGAQQRSQGNGENTHRDHGEQRSRRNVDDEAEVGKGLGERLADHPVDDEEPATEAGQGSQDPDIGTDLGWKALDQVDFDLRGFEDWNASWVGALELPRPLSPRRPGARPIGASRSRSGSA
jgi:hypothetical protein